MLEMDQANPSQSAGTTKSRKQSDEGVLSAFVAVRLLASLALVTQSRVGMEGVRMLGTRMFLMNSGEVSTIAKVFGRRVILAGLEDLLSKADWDDQQPRRVVLEVGRLPWWSGSLVRVAPLHLLFGLSLPWNCITLLVRHEPPFFFFAHGTVPPRAVRLIVPNRRKANICRDREKT